MTGEELHLYLKIIFTGKRKLKPTWPNASARSLCRWVPISFPQHLSGIYSSIPFVSLC